MKTEKDEKARKFLLGKLTEEENQKIEEGYFSDKKLFEDILIAENDLIDAYAAGSLSSEDRKQFENRLLLNPNQRQRVEFAKILVRYASSQTLPAETFDSSPAKSFWTSVISRFISNKPMLSFAFAATVLIFIIGGIWLTFEKQNSKINQPEELALIQTPEQLPDQEKLPDTSNGNQIVGESRPEISLSNSKTEQRKPGQTKQEAPQKKETPVIFSLVLSPGLTRDSGTGQRFTIPAKTDFVKMRLNFEHGDFSSYHAVLETVEGNQVWSSKKLKAQKGDKAVTILIPSKLLKNSDYILALRGTTKDGVYERVEDYAFTIKQ